METVDLEKTSLRDFNQKLHDLNGSSENAEFKVLNPRGKHAVASGIDAPVSVEIDGSVGYYCASMNKQANVVVNGSAGVGLAENIMSGKVHVKGDASSSAAAGIDAQSATSAIKTEMKLRSMGFPDPRNGEIPHHSPTAGFATSSRERQPRGSSRPSLSSPCAGTCGAFHDQS